MPLSGTLLCTAAVAVHLFFYIISRCLVLGTSQHPGVERDRGGERGQGQERRVGDDEAVSAPRHLLRPVPGALPRPVGEPLQRERGDRVRLVDSGLLLCCLLRC